MFTKEIVVYREDIDTKEDASIGMDGWKGGWGWGSGGVGYFDRKQYPQGEMLHDYYKENHVVGGA